MVLDETEAKALNDKMMRLRDELMELGATSCVIVLAYEDGPQSSARSWTADGSFLEQVGLVTTLKRTFDRRIDGSYKVADEDD